MQLCNYVTLQLCDFVAADRRIALAASPPKPMRVAVRDVVFLLIVCCFRRVGMWEPPCCKPTPKLAYRDWRLGCPSDLVILNPETGKPRFNCWPYMNSTAEYTRYEAACYWDGFEKTPPGAMVRQHKLNYYDDCRDNCTARGDGCAGFQFGAYPYEIVPVCYHLKPSSCGECATMYNLPGTGKYRVGAPSWATTHIKVDFAVPGCPAPKDVTIEEGPGYKEIVWR